jgi:hypothetical protein
MVMRRRAINAALDTISTAVNVTENFDQVARRRCWHLSCGQMVDLSLNDDQLLVAANCLQQGHSLEVALQSFAPVPTP